MSLKISSTIEREEGRKGEREKGKKGK